MRLSEFQAKTGIHKSALRYGVVELLGQGVMIQQSNESDILQGLQIFCPPLVLGRANSSCIFAATERAAPPVSIPSLIDLSKTLEFILLQEVPDACSANIRNKAAKAEACQGAGNIVHAGDKCGAHQGHRTIALKESYTIGNIYAIAFSSSQTAIQNRHQVTLRKRLKQVVVIHGPPFEHNVQRNATIMRATYSRYIGGTVGEAETPDSDMSEPALNFLQAWNGSWDHPIPIHHCSGCCDSIEATREWMFSSAIKINLLMPSDVRLPSADDWGSCGQHAALCSLGILCHNILGYCFEVGCPSWSELGSIEIEGQDEVAEIRRKIQKKAYRSNCVLTDNAQRRKKMLLHGLVHLWNL